MVSDGAIEEKVPGRHNELPVGNTLEMKKRLWKRTSMRRGGTLLSGGFRSPEKLRPLSVQEKRRRGNDPGIYGEDRVKSTVLQFTHPDTGPTGI